MNKGINLDFLDRTTNPSEDFYQFVNGGWLNRTEIPSDRSSWGSFHELSKETDRMVLDILDDELTTPGASTNKAARLFETGMDSLSIEREKLSAIDPFIQALKTIDHVDSIPGFLGKTALNGLHSIIHFSVHPDLADSKKYAAYLEPGNLGLPERDYYLDQDDRSIEIRDKYVAYIRTILQNEADFPAERALSVSHSILLFETGMASRMLPKEERRQIEKLYNPHSYHDLNLKSSGWDWEVFFKELKIAIPAQIIVTEPDFISFITEHIKATPLDLLKDYLTFHIIHQSAPYAHHTLESAHFEMYSKTLDGVEVMQPRNERLVKVVNQSLGELLGQMFVARHFPPEAKAIALEMTGDIISAFRTRISSLPWMSEKTREYALEKLETFKVKIGYPDQWKDFSALEIVSQEEGGNYLQNIISVAKWKQHIDYQRIGKEVDPEEWFMAPQVVNAYYNPMFNEIVFPAAILQPPFFDWQVDAAVNYGGMGAVIGHEITHGFDDQGSKFDKEGNLNEWWAPEDKTRFSMLTNKLVNQFDAYRPFDDLALNGTFTLGENIADLGGLSVAYDALQLYYKRHGKPEPIDGFTSDQRYFMSWATIWRTKIRPEALRNQVKTDPHPPGQYRAVAAPSNLQQFYNAFGITPGSRWYREEKERIKIW
ncbi:MAG TPA: M13 family metallopeptidase [Saprospiraceae bacterium]